MSNGDGEVVRVRFRRFGGKCSGTTLLEWLDVFMARFRVLEVWYREFCPCGFAAWTWRMVSFDNGTPGAGNMMRFAGVGVSIIKALDGY